MMKKHIALALMFSVLFSLASCTEADPSAVSSSDPVASSSTGEAPASDPKALTYEYASFINGDDAVIPLAAPDQCLYNHDVLKEAAVDLTWAYDALAYEATHFANPNAENANVSAVYFSQDITPEQLQDVYEHFFFDHPELWYLFQPDKKGCVPDSENPRVAYLTYSDPIAEIPAIDKQINAVVDEILKGADERKLKSDIDREAYLSAYLYENTTIDWDKYNLTLHSSLKEALLEKNAVCVGYATTTVYLLQRQGIWAIAGHGQVSTGMAHCWAIVQKDGKYVYIDNYDMRHKADSIERSIASYFCFDSTAIYDKDHTTIDVGVLLPGCPVGEKQVVTEDMYPDEEEDNNTSSQEE